ncbi:hypothetical protein ACWDSJ_18950 [Nocardia sp. NPDC003482]
MGHDMNLEWTPEEVRALRVAMRQSPREFGKTVAVTTRTVTYWESGRTSNIQAANKRSLDAALENAPSQVQQRFRRAVFGTEASDDVVRVSDVPAGEEVGDVLRREFLMNVSVAGVGAVVGLEMTRHSLNQALEAGPEIDLADWYQIVRDYGYLSQTEAPVRLYELLRTDLLSLQAALTAASDVDRRRELYRVGAFLSQTMAEGVRNVGKGPEAGRWWRTARYAADASGDPHAMLWVRGREAIYGMYDGRAPEQIVASVDATEELMAKGPVIGLPSLLSARAQAYGMLGRAQEAEADLVKLRDVFAQLPSEVINDQGNHCWAHGEERVRFTESYVWSHLGNVEAAEQAQNAALALYEARRVRAIAQIEIQRALCMVQSGDFDGGARYAATVVNDLPAEHHTWGSTGLSESVLSAIPVEDRNRPAAKELRDVIIRTENLNRQNRSVLS